MVSSKKGQHLSRKGSIKVSLMIGERRSECQLFESRELDQNKAIGLEVRVESRDRPLSQS